MLDKSPVSPPPIHLEVFPLPTGPLHAQLLKPPHSSLNSLNSFNSLTMNDLIAAMARLSIRDRLEAFPLLTAGMARLSIRDHLEAFPPPTKLLYAQLHDMYDFTADMARLSLSIRGNEEEP